MPSSGEHYTSTIEPRSDPHSDLCRWDQLVSDGIDVTCLIRHLTRGNCELDDDPGVPVEHWLLTSKIYIVSEVLGNADPIDVFWENIIQHYLYIRHDSFYSMDELCQHFVS